MTAGISRRSVGERFNNEEGILVKCSRTDCPNHENGWMYKGIKRYPELVCCSKCGNKVRLPKEANKK